MRVILKSTGQHGSVPDNLFDPNLYTPEAGAVVNALGGAEQQVRAAKPTLQQDWQSGGIGKVAGNFAGNVLESGAGLVGNVAQAALHPVQTIGNIGNLGLGAAELLIPGEQGHEQAARNVGSFYKQRYGGLSNIANTLYQDPVGAAADVAGLATGAGAAVKGVSGIGKLGEIGDMAKIAQAANKVGTVGRAGSTLERLGAAADPLATMGRGVKAAVGMEKWGNVLPDIGEALTGTKALTKLEGGLKVSPWLSPEEQAIEAATQMRARAEAPKFIYDYLKNNKENVIDQATGNIKSVYLNTDDWRTMFPEYAGTNAPSVHEASSYLNNKLLQDSLKMQKGKGNNTIMQMAGGGGSGKGSALNDHFANEELGLYPIRLDGTFDNYASNAKKSALAKANGYNVETVFIDRTPDQAFMNGVVSRAVNSRNKGDMARTVPLDISVDANFGARQAIKQQILDNPGDNVKVIDNNHAFGESKMIKDKTNQLEFIDSQMKSPTYNKDVIKQNLRNELKQRSELPIGDPNYIPADIAAALDPTGGQVPGQGVGLTANQAGAAPTGQLQLRPAGGVQEAGQPAISPATTAVPGVGTEVGQATRGKLAGAIEGVGKKLQIEGEQMPTRMLKVNPSQKLKAEQILGEPLDTYLTRNNLVGKPETVAKGTSTMIKSLNDEYQGMTRKSGVTDIPAIEFTSKLLDKADEIRGQDLTLNGKRVADKLVAQAEYINEQAAKNGGVITLEQLTDAKSSMFKGTKPSTIDARRMAGSILIDSIDGYAPGSAQIGRDLQKAIEVNKIAMKQAGLGKGTNLLGILKPGGTGGILGFSLGAGPAGVAAGMVTGALTNTERGMKAIAGTEKFLGKALQGNMEVPGIVSKGADLTKKAFPVAVKLGQAGRILTPPGTALPDINQAVTPGAQAAGLPPIGQATKPEATSTGYTVQQLTTGMVKALEAGDTKAYDAIKKMYDLETPGGAKAKSAAQAQVEGKANAGLRAIDVMEQQIASNPMIIALAAIPGSPGARVFAAARSSLVDAIGGLRTGATVSKEQVVYYNQLLPKFGDFPETIQYKLKALRDELGGYIGQNIQDNTLPTDNGIPITYK